MTDATDLVEVVDAVISTLSEHSVAYFITGSFASSVHGEFRATADIDLVAELNASVLPLLVRDWDAAFVADIDQATRALATNSSFNLIHRSTYLKVNLFPCDSAFNQSALERAVSITIPGAKHSLRVSSVEDIILAKLRWFQLGGETSGVQRRDIDQLVALNRDVLDIPYLKRWATAIGVDDLLTRALV